MTLMGTPAAWAKRNGHVARVADVERIRVERLEQGGCRGELRELDAIGSAVELVRGFEQRLHATDLIADAQHRLGAGRKDRHGDQRGGEEKRLHREVSGLERVAGHTVSAASRLAKDPPA